MSSVCACGKRITTVGNNITRKGLPKKNGGIGLHTTGIAKRTFKRNAQKMRVKMPDGSVQNVSVCASCLKAGTYEKV
jgi:large subunit ribosomal protein L28